MSEMSDTEVTLGKARERESKYEWLGAVEFYRKALGTVPETDFFKMGQIQERIGYAFSRAALQAESVNEFREKMGEGVAAYQKCKEFYSRSKKLGIRPRLLSCDAMIALLGYWLALEAPEKKRLVDECWKLTKEALRAFEEAGEALEYGRTYDQLSLSAFMGFFLDWNHKAQERTLNEAVEHGRKAIMFLSTSGDSVELAIAYVTTASFLEFFGYYFHDLDGREKYFQKAKDYWQKANEVSEEIAMIALLSNFAGSSLDWGLGSDKALQNFSKAHEYGKKTKDKFLMGCALEMLTIQTNWSTEFPEDPDGMRETQGKILQYAEEAKHQYSQISFISPRGDVLWVEAPYAENYWMLASFETSLSKRRELLEKALEAEPNLLKRAEVSGCPQNILYAHHVASKIRASLAFMETNFVEKNGLLEKALMHRNESIRLTKLFTPFIYWDQGLFQMYLALIKSELADIAKDPEAKRNMLQEAALDEENAIKLCIKDVAFFEKEGPVSQSINIGVYQYRYGGLLNSLYELTKNSEYLRKAIEAFGDAAEWFHKLNVTSRMAECYWKAATDFDALGEHLKAAENFNSASDNYANAAEKIPQLKDFYQDHARYMQAWSEIEKARHHHERQEYGLAEEHYEKAAEIHKSLKQWSYLAPNYSAWAQVEKAEDLSRKEQSEEAIQVFKQAAKSFNETKTSLQNQLGKIENEDEKQMATNMVKATDLRSEYCTGRITLEEAKVLDKKGDHFSSSEKYGSGAETFEKIIQAVESEQDKKEFKLIAVLSKAWQKMTWAEAEASPSLYVEASQLFEGARDFSPNEKTKMLVLGHSRFCRALEAGTRFADTRNTDMYHEAIKCLESAANYYLRAGFPKASEYSEATKLLFDAFLHMDSAAKEGDPEKKARLYAMAEKVLQTSAGSFMRAEHPEKREQVLGLLERTRKERELAMSLTEVLHAPTIVSTTNSFAMPTPTREQAVGSERFEHADIQANLIIRQKELKVGENLDVEIELVNAGKGPALLVKVTEIIPDSFEITEKPDIYRVEDSYLNMKGKRLDPLKTEEVRLVLKPKAQGVFPLRPTVMYLDENGKYKSHEVEQVTITVKELGIKGWLKGER